jgi:small-conductance mechanosensitive channel
MPSPLPSREILFSAEVLSFAPSWPTLRAAIAQASTPSGQELQSFFSTITLSKSFQAACAILVSSASLYLAEKATKWLSERAPKKFRLVIKQALPFWKGLILIIAISYILRLFLNLTATNLLALTGTIAVALGFAFKDYISSIIAGVVSLFEASYRVGDRVSIGNHYGEVTGYGLRSFQIRTPGDTLVTIPHNRTWTEAIGNANAGQLEAQVSTDFFLGHSCDPDQIIRILYEAAYSSPYTQLNLPIVVLLKEQIWGTRFRLRSYPMDARDEFIYRTDLVLRCKQAFQRLGVSYPTIPGWTEEREE